MKASVRIGAYLLVAAAAGCSAGQAQEFFARPGAYDYFDCPRLASASRKAAARELELKTLIDRASADVFGRFVAVQSYQTDYLKVQGERKLLAEQSNRRNCAAEPAGASSSKKFKPAKSAKPSKAGKPPKSAKLSRPAGPAGPAVPAN